MESVETLENSCRNLINMLGDNFKEYFIYKISSVQIFHTISEIISIGVVLKIPGIGVIWLLMADHCS